MNWTNKYWKWIILLATTGLMIFIVTYGTIHDMWQDGFRFITVIVSIIIGTIISFLLMFIRPIRRLFYPFAPGIWGLGWIFILTTIWQGFIGWLIAGILLVIPASLFMFYMFWSSTKME